MNLRDSIFEYVRKKYNCKPAYLWGKFPSYAALRHQNDKWFAIVMMVEKIKLKIEGEGFVYIIDLKCHSEIIGSLRLKQGFLPAYHMNKEHWISVLLDGSVSIKEIQELIDTSYKLTN